MKTRTFYIARDIEADSAMVYWFQVNYWPSTVTHKRVKVFGLIFGIITVIPEVQGIPPEVV